MATYFIISDVHSFYNEMIKALNEAGYDKTNKNHVLICCGDLLDRGPDALKCLEFINSIPDDRKICIKGNHEYLLESVFVRKYFQHHDIHNGTVGTIYQISNIEDCDSIAIEDCKNNEQIQKYLNSCIDYFETDKYIFVHGWIPCKRSDDTNHHSKNIKFEYDENWRIGNWYDASWICCFDAWNQGIIVKDKTIIAGHWHTSYGHSKYHKRGKEFEEGWLQIWNKLYNDSKIHTAFFDIFKDDGIIAIDACTSYSGKVNCLKLSKQKSLDYWRKINENY